MRFGMHSGPVWLLSREERREIARAHPDRFHHRRRTRSPRRCLYCRSRLANGRAVCSEECDSGWWQVVPTVDGEIYQPTASPAALRLSTTASSTRGQRFGGSGGGRRHSAE
jgi:hypothetical protein